MGLGTVFGALAFGFIFAGMIVFATVVQQSMAEQALESNQQEALQQVTGNSQITITDAAYFASATALWTDNLYREFAEGTTSNTEVLGEGTVIITDTGAGNGTYTSRIIDTGAADTNYTTISWTSVEPLGTDIQFRIRTGTSEANLLSDAFTGPDGTVTSYYTISGTAVNETHDEVRYIQYRAYLGFDGAPQTPELQEVQLGIERQVGHVYVNVTNTGKTKLDPEKTDIYVRGVRVERNMTQRTIKHNDVSEQALWNPGETLEFVVFQDVGGNGISISVANNAATDSIII